MFAGGVASTKHRSPARPDTPFYVASQTKSYLGLTAAALHRRGVFRLDATLDGVWPGLVLPGGLAAARITMLQLLTHRLPLVNDELELRTSWREPVPAGAYPDLLAASQPRRPGFSYANLGYLVYAAALETATGTDWKDWLGSVLLGPLGLTGTSPRAGDFPDADIAWRHKRQNGRWRAFPPKADALMHAAGGLVSSPADLATWMMANLRREAPGLRTRDFDRAQRARVRAPAEDGPFRWNGYALGLQCGAVAGLPVLGHRGGYEGARSLAVFSPGAGAGLAVVVNADRGTRELLDRLAQTFFHCLAVARSG